MSVQLLLVEDEPVVRCLLAETLGDAGFAVTEAACGDAAAALFDDQPDGFDVIVTDVQMPGRLDGMGLARHVRERRATVPILFTTGRPDVLLGGARLGPRERLISKPYRQARIVNLIADMLADTDRGVGV